MRSTLLSEWTKLRTQRGALIAIASMCALMVGMSALSASEQQTNAVAGGDVALSPSVTRRLIARFVAQPDVRTPRDGLEELTGREREVMALAARGLNNVEIGESLTVTPATAKTHVSRAMMKLRARDRAQLVAFAYESGLVASHSSDPQPVQ